MAKDHRVHIQMWFDLANWPRYDLLQPVAGHARTADEITRVFFGQIDPADASHFTIRYQVGKEDGLIDGWLEDNNYVYLRPRYGPRMQDSGYYDQFEGNFALPHHNMPTQQ